MVVELVGLTASCWARQTATKRVHSMVAMRVVLLGYSAADAMVHQKALATVDRWVQPKVSWSASMRVTKRALRMVC